MEIHNVGNTSKSNMCMNIFAEYILCDMHDNTSPVHGIHTDGVDFTILSLLNF